jgi:hypothetical protein
MARVPVVLAAAPLVVVCGALGCQSGPLPGVPSDRGSVSEAETCAGPVAWYVDPLDGSDTADGATEATAIRTLAALPDGLDGATTVALRRGTVTRLRATLQLHGSGTGWVCYSTYGDATAAKPIVAGSVAIGVGDWSAPDAAGRRTLDWTPHRLMDEHHDPDGPEQAPGNLWFFDEDADDAALIRGGWKRTDADALRSPGDWAYDPASHMVTLLWSGDAPAATEAALSLQPAITFDGQEHVVLEDWDVRWAGGYALRGHAASDIRVRRMDVGFIGGATKPGELVRLGNGFETNGDVSDVVVEASRFYEIYDTGFDPQDVSGASHQERLTFRDNLVSRTGLAGVELWARPSAARLEDVVIEGNTFVEIGYGWGYAQHDTDASPQVGAAVLIGDNEADVSGLRFTDNVVMDSRFALVGDWVSGGGRALVGALQTANNTWASVSEPAVVLFEGTVNADGTTNLGASPTFATLADWQTSVLVPARELGSVVDDAAPRPSVGDATRFGAFPLGD